MCNKSDLSTAFNLYEEKGLENTTRDFSYQGLKDVPNIDNKYLCILYLQNNEILKLPEDFFETLPCLTWLDVRDNRLNKIPKSIKNHQHLTHLLLQNNNLVSLPNELGTVSGLNVLQISGNPLTYPPGDVINAGVKEILKFLQDKFIKEMLLSCSDSGDNSDRSSNILSEDDLRSYNSILDGNLMHPKCFSVQLSERDMNEAEEEFYTKAKGKCANLARSRKHISLPHSQSSKYLKPVFTCGKDKQDENIKLSVFKEMAIKKHRDIIASREKILQAKKNLEALKSFRKKYRSRQLTSGAGTYQRTSKDYPYDTSPEYMTLLTREDIEKDLPDKFKKRLWRRPKPTVPRKNNGDVHLAMKIKQLFQNLEAIDLNKGEMTPRTEQRILLSEIQKISEIKQKLAELSVTNSMMATAE